MVFSDAGSRWLEVQTLLVALVVVGTTTGQLQGNLFAGADRGGGAPDDGAPGTLKLCLGGNR